MLTLGYKASAEQFAPRELLGFAVDAERNGFDSVFVSDHFQPWRHRDGHAPFAFAWLAALGERTSRVLLGTSVATPTFRYNPAVAAQAMATIGSLNPGRVIFCVGTGEAMNEVPVGVEWPDQKERYARLREAIELIQRLWTEELVTFEGQFYRTNQATIYDRPDEPVKLYVAAAGPSAARLAGRTGDGLIVTSGKGRELYEETLLPAFAEGATAAGRDPASLDRMIEMKVSYKPDRAEALADCRIWAALSLPAEVKMGVHDPRELEQLAAELPLEQAASRWLVASDPDEQVEQIAPYVELGFRHLVFHSPCGDQDAFLRRYGREVLPRLRERFG